MFIMKSTHKRNQRLPFLSLITVFLKCNKIPRISGLFRSESCFWVISMVFLQKIRKNSRYVKIQIYILCPIVGIRGGCEFAFAMQHSKIKDNRLDLIWYKFLHFKCAPEQFALNKTEFAVLKKQQFKNRFKLLHFYKFFLFCFFNSKKSDQKSLTN